MRLFLPSDLPEMNRWNEARAMPLVTLSELPATGIFEEGVAAGFLYRTDAKDVAFLDGFVSNPEAPSAERFRALASIGDLLSALYRGRYLGVYTQHEGVTRWCRERGYTPAGAHHLYARGAR